MASEEVQELAVNLGVVFQICKIADCHLLLDHIVHKLVVWLCKAHNKVATKLHFSMLTRLLLSMAAVVSSAADECSSPAGQLAGRLVVVR